MAAEHQIILKDLYRILQTLPRGSDLADAQTEAIDAFKDKFKWELENDLPEENIMTKQSIRSR